jgi:predicted nucleic acid-binding protein
MRPLLLDSSVWLAAARTQGEHAHSHAVALLQRESRRELELRLLDLTVYEIGNVTIRKWRRSGREADGLVARVLSIAGLPLVPTAAERREAHALAEQHGLSVYDATYAAVAQERRLTLVSGDNGLLRTGLASAPAEV